MIKTFNIAEDTITTQITVTNGFFDGGVGTVSNATVGANLTTSSLSDTQKSYYYNIQFNSKEVRSGDLFVAIQGKHHDGHNFIVNAIDSGAVVVICENTPNKITDQATYVKVKNSSLALSIL